MSAARQSSPLINLSRESTIETSDSEYQGVPDFNVDTLLTQGLHSCMFGGRDPPISNVMMEEEEEEVEFLHDAGAPGPGNSSTDPIVIADSPDRAATHHAEVEVADSPLVHVNVVSNGPSHSPGSAFRLPHQIHQSASSMTYTFPQLTSFPHLSYQIRLSIPQSATSVFRPTPMYTFPPATFTEHLTYHGAQHDTSPPPTLDFGDVGATQRMIEDFTVKTRFIKRIPSKNKAVNAKRQTPQCPICLEEFQDKVRIRRLRCIHNFHIKCIDQWLIKNMHCPVCRKSIIAP